MNSSSGATSQPGASLVPDATGAITTLHLVIIAVLAIAAIAILVIGARKRHRRRQAAREVERHAEQAGAPPADAPPEQAPERAETPAPAVPSTPPQPPEPPRDEAPPQPPEPDPLADEPIAAAAPLEASYAAEAAPEAASPVPDSIDGASPAEGPVTQLKGLGPKVAAKLAELGITTVGQIARLDDDDAAALDAELGPFRGRMARDRWIEQARFLAAGDRAGFEAVFGKL